MNNEIVQRIFEKMKEQKITQKQLADTLGIGQSSVAAWKLRDCPPPIDYIGGIAKKLNVSIEYLITGTDNPHRVILDSTEFFIIRHYRTASAENKNKIFEYILGLTDEEYMKTNHQNLLNTFKPIENSDIPEHNFEKYIYIPDDGKHIKMKRNDFENAVKTKIISKKRIEEWLKDETFRKSYEYKL